MRKISRRKMLKIVGRFAAAGFVLSGCKSTEGRLPRTGPSIGERGKSKFPPVPCAALSAGERIPVPRAALSMGDRANGDFQPVIFDKEARAR